MLIREAHLSDTESLNQINTTSLGYEYPFQKAYQQLDELLQLPDNQLLVCESEGIVIGYVHASVYRTCYSPMVINILALAVEPNFHSKGCGRLLMEHIGIWGKNLGAAGIRLSSGENRTAAHQFYEYIGFIKRKNQANYYKMF